MAAAGNKPMDLADHEVFLLIACSVLAVRFLWRLTRGIVAAVPFNGSDIPGVVLVSALYAILLGIWIALATIAPENVRSSLSIQALFVAAGAVAIGIGTSYLTLLGIDPVADRIERGNRAAGIATVALWLAIAVCTIAANIGEGEFVATTFTPMIISLFVLFVVVFVLASVTQGFEPIVVDRSVPAALRLAGFLIACSVMLARAGAGDWISFASTTADFGRQLPGIAVLTGVAVFVERRASRRGANGEHRSAATVGLTLVMFAAIAAVDVIFTR